MSSPIQTRAMLRLTSPTRFLRLIALFYHNLHTSYLPLSHHRTLEYEEEAETWHLAVVSKRRNRFSGVGATPTAPSFRHLR